MQSLTIILFSAFIAIVLVYWYNPDWFKIKKEKAYPDNFSRHPDPHIYKGYK